MHNSTSPNTESWGFFWQMKEILETNYHIDSMEAEAALPDSELSFHWDQRLSVAMSQAVFSMMDTDHDDVIAYSEFLAAALQVTSPAKMRTR